MYLDLTLKAAKTRLHFERFFLSRRFSPVVQDHRASVSTQSAQIGRFESTLSCSLQIFSLRCTGLAPRYPALIFHHSCQARCLGFWVGARRLAQDLDSNSRHLPISRSFQPKNHVLGKLCTEKDLRMSGRQVAGVCTAHPSMAEYLFSLQSMLHHSCFETLEHLAFGPLLDSDQIAHCFQCPQCEWLTS